MAGKSRLYRKNLEFIAKDIGKELIPFLTIGERLQGLSAEDILRELSVEDFLRGLNSEMREKLKQLLEEEKGSRSGGLWKRVKKIDSFRAMGGRRSREASGSAGASPSHLNGYRERKATKVTKLFYPHNLSSKGGVNYSCDFCVRLY